MYWNHKFWRTLQNMGHTGGQQKYYLTINMATFEQPLHVLVSCNQIPEIPAQ
jgi:hypothetical protein